MKTILSPIYIILFMLALVMPTTAKSDIANSLGTRQLENFPQTDLDAVSLENQVLLQAKQVDRSSNRQPQNIINSEDAASRAVLNKDVIKKKIQFLQKRGARIGTMVDISSNEKGDSYYLVQLQEIKPERNVTIDSFCVYRSGVIDWLDYVKNRCVGLQNYR